MTAAAPIPLQEVSERAALAPAPDPAALLAAPAPGAWLETEPLSHIEPEPLTADLAGRLGGSGWPEFATGAHGALKGDTLIARVDEPYWWPRFGVLARADGRVFEASAGEVRTWSADLARLPNIAADARGGAVFTPPAAVPRLGAASVVMPFGGVGNYGHFLLDALPALLALEEGGLTGSHRPMAPRLSPWHRELIRLAFGADMHVAEVAAPLVRLESAVFSNLMNHFLHRPNVILARLRDRIVARLPTPVRKDRRVYFTRRRFPQRLMVEEAALEAALRKRGFDIVEPERLTPTQQETLMRECAVLVAPAGAALANVLFLREGAKVFEILPTNFASHWTRDLARLLGADWFGYFAPAPLAEREVPLAARLKQAPRRLLRRYAYAYSLPLADFLAFMDARL